MSVLTSNCDTLELCLGNPLEEPPRLTFREFFTRYQPDGFETFKEDWDLGPESLDDLMEDEWVWNYWFMHDSPSARANSYLQSFDLGPKLAGPNAVGALDFFEDANNRTRPRAILSRLNSTPSELCLKP